MRVRARLRRVVSALIACGGTDLFRNQESVVASDDPPLLVAPFDHQTAQSRQRLWAQRLGKSSFVDTNTIGMKLVLIPAGEFMMGSSESAEATLSFAHQTGWTDGRLENFSREHPRHHVRITRPFLLGQHEVTVGQFRQFVDETDYRTDAELDEKGGWGYVPNAVEKFVQRAEFSWRNWGFRGETDDHPVVNISHNDAVKFCKWLTEKEGKEYSLPTEAQWEYACRSGTATRFYHGDDAEQSKEVSNIADATAKALFPRFTGAIAGRDGYALAAPVGKFRPNGFELYDMHGNVWEWCADWYGAYSDLAVVDPHGPQDGSFRVYRGGGWNYGPAVSRSAYRFRFSPTDCYYALGFRVASDPALK